MLGFIEVDVVMDDGSTAKQIVALGAIRRVDQSGNIHLIGEDAELVVGHDYDEVHKLIRRATV